MMKTRIKKCVAAALVAAGVCAVYAQSAVRDLANIADAYSDRSREKREQEVAPDHIKEIFTLAKTSVEEDFNVNFCGFFTGMSRYDAQDLAVYYKLKDGEYLISAAPGRAVSKLCFSLKGIRRITRGGSTLDELAQAVANRVGDLKRDRESGVYEHRTIDGVVVKMGREGLSIENAGIVSKKPVVTKANAQRDEQDANSLLGSMPVPIVSIIQNMVTIPDMNYKMGKTEVTQAQWEAVMGNNPSDFKNSDNPVENVSWNDCQEFLKKLNALPSVKELGLVFRLPTVKEWEYACRAGSKGDYCKLADGTEITESTLGEVAWYENNSNGKTHPVGQKKPNAFGLYDMHGNVEEWCVDLADDSYRLCRGGGLYGGYFPCSTRGGDCHLPSYSRFHLGFRLVAQTREEKQRAEDKQRAKDKQRAEEKQRVEEEKQRAEMEAREAAARKQKEVVQEIMENMVAIPGKNFKIGKYEVTQKQWFRVMGDDNELAATIRLSIDQFTGDEYPVGGVDLKKCNEYLEKLNAIPEIKASGLTFRLPTEEEWKYACLAGGRKKYCRLTDGTKIEKDTLEKVAWYNDNSDEWPHPVGKKEPNAFGLYDMHGNVSELCYDGRFVASHGGDAGSDARACSAIATGGANKHLGGFRLLAEQK